ncbi:MAG: ankyrin repeat domain-containing protein [Gemmatimonadetes bacterium]|nr:ankyrin repeat domain-containing protein [Gemmatimonadota bacterium]
MEDLAWLAESGQIDALREALAAGADPNAFDDEGRAPLHLAAARDHLAAIDALVDAGADPELAEQAAPGWRPIHRAALPSPVRQHGEASTVRRLLALGASARGLNARGTSALHVCVAWCDRSLAADLLDAGADPGASDVDGITPLHVAVRRGAPSLTEQLLGDDGEWVGPARAHRDTSAVARLEDEPVLLTLIDAGANPDAADALGRTPLHDAAERGVDWAVRALLDAGAQVNALDHDRATPLHRAASSAVATRLLDAGADPDLRDRDGRTPLHAAIGAGRTDVVELLLDRGASPAAVDVDGRTPLHLAAGSGQGLVVDRLLDLGADPAARDEAGRTPLDDAQSGDHSLVVQRLKRRGGGWRFPFFRD